MIAAATGKELKARTSLSSGSGFWSRSNWERIESARRPPSPRCTPCAATGKELKVARAGSLVPYSLAPGSNWERIEKELKVTNCRRVGMKVESILCSNWERIERVAASFASTATRCFALPFNSCSNWERIESCACRAAASSLRMAAATGKELKDDCVATARGHVGGQHTAATGKELKENCCTAARSHIDVSSNWERIESSGRRGDLEWRLVDLQAATGKELKGTSTAVQRLHGSCHVCSGSSRRRAGGEP